MRRVVTAVILTGVSWCAASAETDCQLVVAETVAEVRAGFSAVWTEQSEQLARSAAGAACVKAQSGRYGAGGTLGAAQSSGASDDPGNDDGEGLTFRPLSGSPSKKPYQRARSTGSD